jgi:hypothetical protein
MLEESRIQTCHDDADIDLPITPIPRTTSPEPDFYARFFDTMNRPSIRMLLYSLLLLLIAPSPWHSTGLDSSNASSATTRRIGTVTENVLWQTAEPTFVTDAQL